MFCPICSTPMVSGPFCSEPCRMVDLNRWLSDVYVVPGEKISEDQNELE